MPLTDKGYAQLYDLQMSDDPTQQALASSLAKKLTPDEGKAFVEYQQRRWKADGGSELHRVDNSILGMPPEAVAAGGLSLGRAVLQPGLTLAQRAAAGAGNAVAQVKPMAYGYMTQAALKHMGFPDWVADVAGIAVGARAAKGGMTAAGEAAPAEAAAAAPAPPGAPPQAPPGPPPFESPLDLTRRLRANNMQTYGGPEAAKRLAFPEPPPPAPVAAPAPPAAPPAAAPAPVAAAPPAPQPAAPPVVDRPWKEGYPLPPEGTPGFKKLATRPKTPTTTEPPVGQPAGTQTAFEEKVAPPSTPPEAAAPPTPSNAALRNQLAVEARKLGMRDEQFLSEGEMQSGLRQIKKGHAPEAVARLIQQQRLDAMTKTASTLPPQARQAFEQLVRSGKTPDQALDAIRAQLDLQSRLGGSTLGELTR